MDWDDIADTKLNTLEPEQAELLRWTVEQLKNVDPNTGKSKRKCCRHVGYQEPMLTRTQWIAFPRPQPKAVGSTNCTGYRGCSTRLRQESHRGHRPKPLPARSRALGESIHRLGHLSRLDCHACCLLSMISAVMLESCLFGCVLSVFLSGNFLVIFLPFSIGIKHWGRTDCPSGVALLLLKFPPHLARQKYCLTKTTTATHILLSQAPAKKKIDFIRGVSNVGTDGQTDKRRGSKAGKQKKKIKINRGCC